MVHKEIHKIQAEKGGTYVLTVEELSGGVFDVKANVVERKEITPGKEQSIYHNKYIPSIYLPHTTHIQKTSFCTTVL